MLHIQDLFRRYSQSKMGIFSVLFSLLFLINPNIRFQMGFGLGEGFFLLGTQSSQHSELHPFIPE